MARDRLSDSAADREAYRRWAATWERAGAALEEIRRDELRAMTLEDQWRAVAAIFATPIACDASETSGLVILREVLDRSR